MAKDNSSGAVAPPIAPVRAGPTATVALLQEIGDGTLYLGGSGQGYEVLQRCPVAQANRPGLKARVDTAYICRFDGTDFFQWYGRKADGYFHPFGKIMRMTEAGRAVLKRATEV